MPKSTLATSTIKNIIGTVSSTYEGITAYRSGNVITIRFSIPSRSFSSGWNVVGTIDPQYRPPAGRDFIILNNNATSHTNYPLQIRIADNGQIAVYSFGTSNLSPIGTVTYIV